VAAGAPPAAGCIAEAIACPMTWPKPTPAPMTDTHAGHAALVLRRLGNGVGDLVLREAAHVADHVHADLLVEDFLQFFRQRDVLDDQRIERQAEIGEQSASSWPTSPCRIHPGSTPCR
jgi:hypothetical protein